MKKRLQSLSGSALKTDAPNPFDQPPVSDDELLVVSVEENSPAQRAGLVEGDVMIGFEDQPIAAIDDLHKVLTEERVGVKTGITIIRRTEKVVLEIVPEKSRPREDE
jgi:S1-C subfamily serine protease